MKGSTMYCGIFEVFGNSFEVEYIVHGKYIPATLYDPPEYPDVEIVTILLLGEPTDDFHESWLDHDSFKNELLEKIYLRLEYDPNCNDYYKDDSYSDIDDKDRY
jgi:hypothetical protein